MKLIILGLRENGKYVKEGSVKIYKKGNSIYGVLV
jgi:hypothetical protein